MRSEGRPIWSPLQRTTPKGARSTKALRNDRRPRRPYDPTRVLRLISTGPGRCRRRRRGRASPTAGHARPERAQTPDFRTWKCLRCAQHFQGTSYCGMAGESILHREQTRVAIAFRTVRFALRGRTERTADTFHPLCPHPFTASARDRMPIPLGTAAKGRSLGRHP